MSCRFIRLWCWCKCQLRINRALEDTSGWPWNWTSVSSILWSCVSGTHSALVGPGLDRSVKILLQQIGGDSCGLQTLGSDSKNIIVLSGFTWIFTSVHNEARSFWKIAISRGCAWTCTSLAVDWTACIPCNMDVGTGWTWSSYPLWVAAQVNPRKLLTRWPAWTDDSSSSIQASQHRDTSI